MQHFRRTHLGERPEAGTEVPGEIGHPGELADAALVDPVHELPCAERPAAELRDERLQRRARQPEQVGTFWDPGAHGGTRFSCASEAPLC